MAARMEKVKNNPGIYRRGGGYVVVYRVNGRQRKESARTLREAQRLKASRVTDRNRGEFDEQSRVAFREYASEWVGRYPGRRRGFRESTREDYKRDLERYAYPFFDERLGRTVSQVTPRDVANFVAYLCEEREAKRLADATVRRILAPVRSCFATAVREGIVRHNPAVGASLPHRPGAEPEGEEVRVLSREQLRDFLRQVHPSHRAMFRLLATTGLRWSEGVAVRWQDLALDGSRPHVKVRRALVRGRYGPPKSRHSKRDVPLENSTTRTRCAGCCAPSPRRSERRGRDSTPSGTPVLRCSSNEAPTRSRYSGGSGTTPRRSRSTPTSTCSRASSGSRSSSRGS